MRRLVPFRRHFDGKESEEKMAKGLMIKADSTTFLVMANEMRETEAGTLHHPKFQLEQLQELIGGDLEFLSCKTGLGWDTIIVDGDGFNKRLPINEGASFLFGFRIVGPALICCSFDID
jgi:hypothetical protein